MAVTEGGASRPNPRGRVVNIAVLSWVLTLMLVVGAGATPHASAMSRLLHFGALQSEGLPLLVSHRGAALDAPENTLAAIRHAITQGANAVELDVQLTSDHVPVLMHDPTLQRTTNGLGRVNDRTAAELATLDAGAWFHPSFAGEPIPTLSAAIELLETAPALVFLELKDNWTEEQLVPVIEELRARILLHRVVLQSFNVDTLAALQRVAPEFARVMLTRELGVGVTERALQLGVSGVGAKTALFAAFPLAAAHMRERGLGIAVYTLNTEEEWQFAADFGFDLVISDDPLGYEQWRASELGR